MTIINNANKNSNCKKWKITIMKLMMIKKTHKKNNDNEKNLIIKSRQHE